MRCPWQLACMIVLGLAACQPVPRPFQPADKSTLDFSNFGIADKLVVFVAGVDGAPPEIDRAISTTLAKNLRDRGVVASTASANPGQSFAGLRNEDQAQRRDYPGLAADRC